MTPLTFEDHPWSFKRALDEGLYRGYGLRAVDGDTCDLIVDAGFRQYPQIRVRLRKVDTPEIYGVQEGSVEYEAGKAAQARVAGLVEGRPVLVDSRADTGKYGRWLADIIVWDEGTRSLLSQVLLNEGLAE